MNQSPLNKQNFTRVQLAAGGLAVVLIVGFIVVWQVLGNAGFEPAARLIGSLCLPPALITLVMGVVVLVRK